MRRVVRMLGVLALVAAGCGEGGADPSVAATTAAPSSATPSATTATSTTNAGQFSSTAAPPRRTYDPNVPRYGGIVVVAHDEEPATLSPYAPGGSSAVVALVGQAHLAGVHDVDADTLQLIPELVTELPTVTNGRVVVNVDGSMDVTWQLRSAARWSDGTPITGADMAFTAEFMAASRECSGFGLTPDPLPEFELISVEDKSLTARFSTASLRFETLFPWLVPSHVVTGSDYCEDWNSQIWPAAGPFVIEEWVDDDAGRRLRLVRNANYWKIDGDGNQLPYLDAVEFAFVPEAGDVLSSFAQREVDVISPSTPIRDIPLELWQRPGVDFQIVPGPIWEHLNFQFGPNNRNPESLNLYLEFRRAVAHAIDRRALLDAAGYEWLEVSDGFVGHFTRTVGSEPWAQYPYDPGRAGELLATACELAGRDCATTPPRIIYSTTANAPYRPAVARALSDQLARVGIAVELQLEDSQLFFSDTLEEGTWDMGAWGWAGLPGAGPLVEAVSVFHPAEPPSPGRNFYRWGTPGSTVEGQEAVLQAQHLIDEMRATVDADRIFSLAVQLERIIADQVVIIPLNGRAVVGGVWADEIQGFRMNPSTAGPTWNIESWYRVGE